MYKKIFYIILTLSMILCFAFSSHAEMVSTNYKISISVISGAGDSMSSSNYQIESTLGQSSPVISQGDPSTSASYKLYPGFWYTIAVTEMKAMPWLYLLLFQ